MSQNPWGTTCWDGKISKTLSGFHLTPRGAKTFSSALRHSSLKVFALPSPIQPSEKPPSGHHLYLSLDPKFDGEHDFEGLLLCGDGLGRRIYESSRAWIRCLRLVTDLRPVPECGREQPDGSPYLSLPRPKIRRKTRFWRSQCL